MEIVEAHPELELVAAASGLVADRRPRAADPGRRRPDRAARARRAGRRPQRRRRLRRPPGDAVGARARRRPRARQQGEPRRGRRPRARGPERGGGRLLPVDSEHSAALQCLEGRAAGQVDSLVLTASGGPFRGRTRDELDDVTPEEALAHPTWSMGPKITIDSATLANKGLELIEAHFLFGLAVRADRGRRPPDVDRPRARALPRRRGARASRLPGHARADLVRAHLPGPRRDAGSAARPRLGPDARVPRARPRDVPDARARPRGGRAGRHRPVRLQRRQRGRRRRVPRRSGSRSSTSPRPSRRRSPPSTARRPRPRRPRPPPTRRRARLTERSAAAHEHRSSRSSASRS